MTPWMKSDPASRRARNVVMLVIVTVALPSLVLTALGVAAIRNEEVATKKRAERLYLPLLAEVAEDFNRRFDAVVEKAEPALVDLLEWSRDPDYNLTQYRRFIDQNPAATNFFILDDEGNALTPIFSTAGADCCFDARCFNIADFHPNPAAARACTPKRRAQQVGRLLKPTCHTDEHADPETLELARHLLTSEAPEDYRGRSRFIAMSASLAARLGDPTRSIDPWWAQEITRALMYRFEELPAKERRWAGGIIALQSQREALLDGLSRLARTKSTEVVIAGLEVRGLRRLVVLLNDGNRTAGFELAPTPLERGMNELLIERDLNEQLEAHVGPLITPKWWQGAVYPEFARLTKEQTEARMITWVLCSRSNINWAFELLLVKEGMLANLGRSRSGLYLWALILVGIALVGGIVYTVQAVIHEAWLSRLKTDFVSSVSHDLRTPLTSIRMFSETLRAGRYESEAERHEFLQIIIDEAERLSRLTERILDFSRMEAGRKSYRKQPTDIRALVEGALTATKPMIDAANFEVEIDAQDDLPPVPVDRDAMVEVLINLFSNAVKYSPDHQWMGILVTSNDHEVRIAVRDQGIGIRKNDQGRIFDKFYRVDTRRAAEVGGSGIGLSLVKHIVDMHGGAVEVESTPGSGSTFTVRLPISADGDVDCAQHSAEKEGSWTASWS